MQVALAQVCVDDRLDHTLLRTQIRSRVAQLGLPCDQVFIVNEIGGNMGSSFRNTVQLVRQSGGEITLAAVLHHDDCRAAKAGMRKPLDDTVAQVAAFLDESGMPCALVAGQIDTATNQIDWQTEQRVDPAS